MGHSRMLGLVGLKGEAVLKSERHDVSKPLPSLRHWIPGRRRAGSEQGDVLKFSDRVRLYAVCEMSWLLGRQVLDVRVDMTRVVGNDNRMRSTARMAVSRVDRLCLLGAPEQRNDDMRSKARRDPDDGSEKAVAGHYIGCRGLDKNVGRMNWMAG